MSATTTPIQFPKAVIFDAYGTLFDVHSVVAAAEQMFPGHGDALSQLWRLKQIEYTQLRTLSDPAGARYRPFWDITLDALRYAARRLNLPLRQRLPAEELGVAPHGTGGGMAELAAFIETAALTGKSRTRPSPGA
jgi:2-haloalkanoic acid dehalogenase type II